MISGAHLQVVVGVCIEMALMEVTRLYASDKGGSG